jgi:hypothetical protein
MELRLLGKRRLNAGMTGIAHFASRRTLGDGILDNRIYWDGPVVYGDEDGGKSWYLVSPPDLSDRLGFNHPLWLLDALLVAEQVTVSDQRLECERDADFTCRIAGEDLLQLDPPIAFPYQDSRRPPGPCIAQVWLESQGRIGRMSYLWPEPPHGPFASFIFRLLPDPGPGGPCWRTVELFDFGVETSFPDVRSASEA